MQKRGWLSLLVFVAVGLGAPANSLGQAGIPYKVGPADTNPSDDIVEGASSGTPAKAPEAVDLKKNSGTRAPALDFLKVPNAQQGEYRSMGRQPSYFIRLWEERRIALAKNEAIKAQGLLKELIDKKTASGWPNVFRYGAVLARESDGARERGQQMLALELADAAVAIAPNLAATHLAQLKSRFRMGFAFVKLLESFIEALKASYLEAPELQRRAGNFLLIAVVVLLVSFTLFGVMVSTRHFRAFVHDLFHFLPGATVEWQTYLIGGSVFLAPIVFGFGLLGAGLWWVVIAGLYLESKERVLAGFFCLSFVFLPGLAPQLGGHFFYNESRSQSSYFAARDVFGESDAARLRTYPEPTFNDHLIFAMRAAWSGEGSTALDILEKNKGMAGVSAEYWVALGNARFRSGKKGEAIDAYERAIQDSPKSVSAYFNLSRGYYSLAKHSAGAGAHAQAVRLDHKMVTDFESQVKGYYDVVDADLSYLVAGGDSLWDTSKRPAVGDALWDVIGAPLGRRSASLFSLGALIALILLAAFRERVRTSRICLRCGEPSCGRCAQGLPNLRLCWECHRSFIETFGIDKHLRIRKQLQSHRYHARRKRVVRGISWVVAGLGHFANGRPITGGLLLVAYLGGIGGLLVAVGGLAAPVNGGSDATGLDLGVSLVVILGSHLVTRLTRRERVG